MWNWILLAVRLSLSFTISLPLSRCISFYWNQFNDGKMYSLRDFCKSFRIETPIHFCHFSLSKLTQFHGTSKLNIFFVLSTNLNEDNPINLKLCFTIISFSAVVGPESSSRCLYPARTDEKNSEDRVTERRFVCHAKSKILTRNKNAKIKTSQMVRL